jgi:hypothetical protein
MSERSKWHDERLEEQFAHMDDRFDRLEARFDRLQIALFVTLGSILAAYVASH